MDLRDEREVIQAQAKEVMMACWEDVFLQHPVHIDLPVDCSMAVDQRQRELRMNINSAVVWEDTRCYNCLRNLTAGDWCSHDKARGGLHGPENEE